jgi:hypothetical protein
VSHLFLTISTDSLAQAISDLALKMEDLQSGTQTANIHFEQLIGSSEHPDITKDEKIARLCAVYEELSKTWKMIEQDKPSGELSEEAMLVLSSYQDASSRPKLEVEHMVFGPGIPSAELLWAATVTRGKLAQILQVITEDGDPPEETFYNFFVAYEEEIGTDTFEEEDDIWLISVSISYLEALIESPGAAWSGEIEIPVILKDFVLDPYLELARKSVCLH